MSTILDSGVAEKIELSLCVPLHCGSFAFMGPFNAMVPFASCGPFSPREFRYHIGLEPFHLCEALDWRF